MTNKENFRSAIEAIAETQIQAARHLSDDVREFVVQATDVEFSAMAADWGWGLMQSLDLLKKSNAAFESARQELEDIARARIETIRQQMNGDTPEQDNR